VTLLSHRSVGPLGLLIAVVVGTPLAADTPAIETLVAGVPILTPDNDRIHACCFTLETPLPFEVPLAATLVWQRPDKYGMIVVAGQERSPFWFLSQKKSMMFDVTTGTAVLNENAGATFIVQVADEKSTITYSLTSQKDSKVLIDLPSLLRGAAKNGKVEGEASGDWRVTFVSESGKSKVTAAFRNSATFPIRSVEVRSSADDSLSFAIRDIAINADMDRAWPDFPARESFPKTLRLIVSADRKIETAGDPVEMVAHGIRSLAAQGALRNPKWRNLPYLANVDWNRAKQANEEFGPPLRKLLDKEWKSGIE
jgi:hypothetical protein